jgi:hypothetical protein
MPSDETAPAPARSTRTSDVLYLVGAFAIGAVTAASQGFALNAEGLGAAMGSPLLGLLFGWLAKKASRGTARVPQVAFWTSLVLLAVNALTSRP